MYLNTCSNCNATVKQESAFCSACGQKINIHRLSIHEIWHDMIHAFLHADKSYLQLTKQLLLRPGIVAKEYVSGKRKKYFNPFSYLVINIAISAFVIKYFHLFGSVGNAKNAVSNFAEKNSNLIFFLAVPVTAFISYLLFRKKKYNFAENLSFYAFLSGFRVFFFLLIFAPLVYFFKEKYYLVLSVYLVIWLTYVVWASFQFYEEKKLPTILKSLTHIVLTQIIMMSIIGLVAYIIYLVR